MRPSGTFHDRVREGFEDMTLTVQEWVRVGKVAFGKGVFARKDIPKGTVVGYVDGRVIDDPGYATSYCIDLGGSLSLEPRAPFRFLNHCCTPNSHLCLEDTTYEDGTPAPPIVSVESICDIPKGAEVTIDYRWAAHGAIKCLCGSSGCRGWVVAEEEMHLIQKPRQRKAK
jgi:hypothetical protein